VLSRKKVEGIEMKIELLDKADYYKDVMIVQEKSVLKQHIF
jgi:hypothetical protein